MPYDLVIHNGTLVTVNDSFEIIPAGLICVKAGRLERVENLPENQSPPAADETMGCREYSPQRTGETVNRSELGICQR